MKTTQAKHESRCPQCKGPIKIGDRIAMPQVKNRSGGNHFSGCWYCFDCAADFEEIGPSYPFIDNAARVAHEDRCAPIHARMKAREKVKK